MGYPNLWGLLICTGDDCWAPVPLEGIAVSVTVRGFVAQVKATLRYKNDCKSPMEVMFKCPCDEGSAIYHVEAKINDRTIVGRCLEKKKAEEVYQEAVAAGRTALLVREDVRTADIISLALGNLPPESTAEVTLSLVCDLAVAADGGVQFTLPTLLNPRYNPVDGPTEDPHVSAGLGYVMSVSKPYVIEVTATVTGGQSIARVVSHTDPINVVIEEDDTQAKITLDGGAFRTDHDWSFVVYYSNPYHPHALVETGDSTELGLMKDQVLMINMFPELPEGSYSHYNEVIFIIDRSGSMGGENIQNARAVLLLFLKSLPPGCRFNVISFGSHHTLLFPEGSRQYNEANLALALKLHKTMDADMGGTEILQPLKTVYSKPADPEYSRQILMLTDGEVFNVDQVTELAERNSGNTRVFAVGIGDGASTALIKGLARAGGGRAELVTQRDRMQTKVMGLVSSMLQSSVRKVSVSCELDTPGRLRLVPEVPPTIFAGQHLITYARMPPNAQLKSITLTGTVDGQPWSASLSHEQVKIVHDASLALHRLAAKALIRHGYADDSDGAREEMIALSTSSGVLSRYTALVAVDQDGKAFQAPKVNVPQYQQQCFMSATQDMVGVGGVMQPCPMFMAPQMMARSCQPMKICGFSSGGRSGMKLQTSSSLFGNAPPPPPPPPAAGLMTFGCAAPPPPAADGMTFGCAAPPPPPAADGMTFDCARFGASTGSFGAVSTGFGMEQFQQAQFQQASTFGTSLAGNFSFGASAPASRACFEAASPQRSGAFGGTASAPEARTGFKFGVQPQESDSVDCCMESESDDADCGRLGGSMRNATLDDDEVKDFTDSKSDTEGAASSPEDVLMNLITCQKFDGSWRLDDVASALAVDRCDLQKGEVTAPDESTLATGLATVILQEGFSDRKEEWQLLANKARSFLQQNLWAAEELKSGISLESFLESLKQLLKDLTAKYPNLVAVMTKK